MIYRFEDFELHTDLFELRHGGVPRPMEPQVFQVLAYLVEHHGRVVPKRELLDHVWPERFITEAALNSRIMAARKALDDDGRNQRLIKTVHGRGFRFAGVVEGQAAQARLAAGQGRIDAPPVSYARTSDGFNIAYSVSGEGPPLVRTIAWFTHLEREWRWRKGYEFWSRFAANHRFVRFDGRGMGLSDPTDDYSIETRVRDLEAVVDAAGLERFALLGISSGCYQAVLYAARHPERVTHLMTYGGGPDGSDEAENEAWIRHWDSLRRVMRSGWGGDTDLYRQLFTNLLLGEEASAEDRHEFNEIQRYAIDGRGASRFIGMTLDPGISEHAAQLRIPALVMHRRDDLLVPFSRSRRLAALIPGARLLALEGRAHWPVLDPVATAEMVTAVEELTAG